jgi:hypothetical protein
LQVLLAFVAFADTVLANPHFGSLFDFDQFANLFFGLPTTSAPVTPAPSTVDSTAELSVNAEASVNIEDSPTTDAPVTLEPSSANPTADLDSDLSLDAALSLFG